MGISASCQGETYCGGGKGLSGLRLRSRAAGLWTLWQRIFLDAFLSPKRFLATLREFRALSDMLFHPGIGNLQVSEIPAPGKPIQMLAVDRAYGGLPPQDLHALPRALRWIQPMQIFEVGTFNGVTTAHLALNSDAEIYTLDLPRELAVDLSRHAPLDAALLQRRDDIGSAYRCCNTDGRIRQLFGDSRTFDYSPYRASMELVVVDACHLFDYVMSDSHNALELLGARGAILWHDFESSSDVVRACKLLARSEPIFHIEGTWLALPVRDASGWEALP
jgi:predicted O-methyltransferase YrrM